MPLADILRKIEDTGRAESEKILAEAEQRRSEIESSAREEAERRKERILGEARRRASEIESLAKSRSDGARRQIVLRGKQELVESVFASALLKLADMPSREYRDLLIRSLCAAAEGRETVAFGAEDEAKLGADFVGAVNAALIASGKPGELTVTFAPSSFGGGYILSSGGISQNLTFPTLVGRLRDEMEMEVARVLFA